MSFGFLTTLGPSRHCYAQARVLGQALSVCFPSIPRAVVGSARHVAGLQHHGWQLVASEDKDLQRGFESKLELWKYTPFEHTLFLDVDILPVCSEAELEDTVAALRASEAPVAFFAERMTGEGDHQGTLVPELKKRGVGNIWATRAGGHYFWSSEANAAAVFVRAKEIVEAQWPEVIRYKPAISGQWHTPDEVVVSIALAQLYSEAVLPGAGDFMTARQFQTGGTGARFVHFIDDEHPWLYQQLGREIGVSRFSLGAATFWWAYKMSRKAFWHYARGGDNRIRTSRQKND